MDERLRKVGLLFKKIWKFLIHDDSWQSFLADALIIILVGKFIFFPALGLVMGTELPVVAVVSNSMDHNNLDLDTWWSIHGSWYEQRGITKDQFEQYWKPQGFNKGDIIVITGNEEPSIGDVIVYSVPGRSTPIIHRIVAENPIQTKGDANMLQISFENNIQEWQVQGKAISVIPYFGWVKVGFVELIGWG